MDQAIVQQELTKIEKASRTLTDALKAIRDLRARDEGDPEGIGRRAELDLVAAHKAIGESLGKLQLL